MSYLTLSRLACAFGLAMTAATAAAAPVTLDSESKAAAAIVTAMRVQPGPAGNAEGISTDIRAELELGLKKIAASSTPAALMNARNGITVPCATSGSLTARMARALPRVLRFTWTACAFTDESGYGRQLDGPAEVVLLTDSFAPDKVAAIRFGSLDADFVDRRHVEFDDQISDEARSSNMRMVGLIPMQRAFPPYGLYVGNFAFEITGFQNTFSSDLLPGSGLPPFESNYRQTLEHLVVSGALTYDASKTRSIDDWRLYSGKLATSISYSDYPDSASEWTASGYRSRHTADYSDPAHFVMTDSVDGRIEYQYPARSSITAGCPAGIFDIRTRAPIVRNLSSPRAFDSGELLINGSTIVRLYTAANVPAGLPVPVNDNLIHVEVPQIGIFNYDSRGLGALQELSQCY